MAGCSSSTASSTDSVSGRIMSFKSSKLSEIGATWVSSTGSSEVGSSTATNETPHSGHDSLSAGMMALHAPHSPSCSSVTPPNRIPQFGHDSLSSGTIESHAPHCAIGISRFSSDITATQVSRTH